MNSHLVYAEGKAPRLEVAAGSYGPRGRGALVTYTIVLSEFGFLLIAATSHGVCWLGIHPSAAHLESALRGDFPKAAMMRNDDAMREVAERVTAFVGGTRASLELPLDIRATPFQLAVWRELCVIPRGATSSYGEIARRLGQPRAARAVGRANGSNPLAVLIPCHRAVAADGELTGYRWGVDCKRRLLQRERAISDGRKT